MSVHYNELKPLFDQLIEQLKLSSDGGRQAGSMIRTSPMERIDFPEVHGLTGGVHPSVIHFPGGFGSPSRRFWMAYTPYPLTINENPVVVCSNDGYEWTTPAGLTNPLDGPPETGYYSDTELVYTPEGKLRCYWRWAESGPGSGLMMMESSNGSDWSEPIDCGDPPLSPSIIVDLDGNYVMWGGSRKSGSITRYTSADGIEWSAAESCTSNVDGYGYHWHPFMWREGTALYCLSSVISFNPSTGANPGDLYFGYSTDGGLHWDFDASPIVARGEEGFNSTTVYRSCAVRVGNRHLLYVSGLGAGSWQIRVAEAVLRIASHGASV